MLEALLNSRAGASAASSAAAALFAPDPSSTTVSGGPFDARAFAGAGAGWNVATGNARAEGARMTDAAAAAYGPSAVQAAPMQAGTNWVLMLVLASVALGLILRGRKGA